MLQPVVTDQSVLPAGGKVSGCFSSLQAVFSLDLLRLSGFVESFAATFSQKRKYFPENIPESSPLQSY